MRDMQGSHRGPAPLRRLNTHLYCSREHQVQAWPKHKAECKNMKEAKTKADDLEAKLRADGEYESKRGKFWDSQPHRLYLQARLAHAEILIESRRQQGIEDALTLCLGMLQQDRADHLDCRYIIPPLYLRLGRDQECYDFLKWYALAGVRNQDPIKTTKRFLNIKNADALSRDDLYDLWLEPNSKTYTPELFHLAPLLLLMMRLNKGLDRLMDYKDQHPKAKSDKIMAGIRPDYAGDILERHPDVIASKVDDDSSPLEIALYFIDDAIDELIQTINTWNANYLPMVLKPGPESAWAKVNTGRYTLGSEEEAGVAFKHTFDAWMESPRMVEELRDRLYSAMSGNPQLFSVAIEKSGREPWHFMW